jgi:L,D-transpeptidase YcbB
MGKQHVTTNASATARRTWRTLLPAAACIAALAMPAQAQDLAVPFGAERAAVTPAALLQDVVQKSDPDLYGFYHQRGYRSLWIGADGALSPAARTAVGYIQSASVDGLEVDFTALNAALSQLGQGANPAAVTRAELALSQVFGAYVQALRDTTRSNMVYEHWNLKPDAKRPYFHLLEASKAPSLDEYVRTMGWMHPLYAQVREQLVSGQHVGTARLAGVKTLERLRSIAPTERHILVDSASATLWMYEGGRAVDSMKVVVGKPAANTQTPIMAGYVRYAIFNPYWNVPEDLVVKNIANNVLNRGAGYLKTSGYEVLSDWTETATVIDPTKVDWKAAARGELDVRVRQKPRFGNAMGAVKYEFPNPMGIYLHDTPEMHLMKLKDRHKSSGCIRLEDADRLGRWLFGGDVPEATDAPEQRVDLPALVPIYVTYLTALPEEGQLAVLPDSYGLDTMQGGPAPALASERPPETTLASDTTVVPTPASLVDAGPKIDKDFLN